MPRWIKKELEKEEEVGGGGTQTRRSSCTRSSPRSSPRQQLPQLSRVKPPPKNSSPKVGKKPKSSNALTPLASPGSTMTRKNGKSHPPNPPNRKSVTIYLKTRKRKVDCRISCGPGSRGNVNSSLVADLILMPFILLVFFRTRRTTATAGSATRRAR